jgi:hypothetical protein
MIQEWSNVLYQDDGEMLLQGIMKRGFLLRERYLQTNRRSKSQGRELPQESVNHDEGGSGIIQMSIFHLCPRSPLTICAWESTLRASGWSRFGDR